MSKVWTAPLFVAAAIMGLLGFALLPGETTVWAGLFQVGVAIAFLVAGLLSRRREPTPGENRAIPWIAAGLLALVLVFGGRQANIALLELGVRGPSAIEVRAKSEVAAQLRDPQSAVFTNVANDGFQVCGEVNGRNGFGACAGCFWHRHPGCRFATTPATRPDFWSEKFRQNVIRDQRNLAALRDQGWRVATVWECDLRLGGDVIDELAVWLREGSPADGFDEMR